MSTKEKLKKRFKKKPKDFTYEETVSCFPHFFGPLTKTSPTVL